jgi:hypothetical protein
MKISSRVLAAALAVGVLTSGGVALAQMKSKADCDKAKASTPHKVEGQVVSVDAGGGTVTVKEANGATHQFQASKETLQTLKPGDKIEANLREIPNC